MRWILACFCVLLGCGYIFLTGWYPDVAWLQGLFPGLIWPVAITTLALLLMLLARHLLAHDPLLSSWAILGLAGCLLIIPLILAREQQAKVDHIAEERLAESREALRIELIRKQKIEKERMARERAEREERAETDRFVQYEGKIPDATLDTLRDLDQRMRAEVDAQAEAYAKALQANPTKGPESWIRFRTLDQLEVEMAAHKTLYEQTRSFTQFMEAFEGRYTEAIEALQLKPPADRIAIAEMERILQFWDRARIYDLRQLDVRLLGAAIASLNVLREAWGTWSFNPREKKVLFENPAQEGDFYENLRLVQAIALEVETIRGLLDEDDPARD